MMSRAESRNGSIPAPSIIAPPSRRLSRACLARAGAWPNPSRAHHPGRLPGRLRKNLDLGWRSAFRGCARTRISAARWNDGPGFSREAASECSPPRKPWGELENGQAPEGRKSSSHTDSFSAAIKAALSLWALRSSEELTIRIRAPLQRCRKCRKISVGFSRCGTPTRQQMNFSANCLAPEARCSIFLQSPRATLSRKSRR